MNGYMNPGPSLNPYYGHQQDSDCYGHLNRETGCCRVCGALHESDPCGECKAVAYHTEDCSEWGKS
jgi:hypothetical protein